MSSARIRFSSISSRGQRVFVEQVEDEGLYVRPAQQACGLDAMGAGDDPVTVVVDADLDRILKPVQLHALGKVLDGPAADGSQAFAEIDPLQLQKDRLAGLFSA